jgi:hypothetical protein
MVSWSSNAGGLLPRVPLRFSTPSYSFFFISTCGMPASSKTAPFGS